MSRFSVSQKQHDWKDSKVRGDAGEKAFAAKHPELVRLDGFKGEFTIGPAGKKVELKTDYYLMQSYKNRGKSGQTNNCAIEVRQEYYSGVKKKTGVWQAIEHGCSYFVYWFMKDDVEFWFDPKQLWNFAVDRYNGGKHKIVKVDNPKSRFYSHCVLIPYEELSEIALPSPLEVEDESV